MVAAADSERALSRQRVAFGFAAEQHRDDAEQRKASHERRHPVEAAAERADEEPRDKRAKARDDPRAAGAKADRRRADVGREQLRQVDRITRKDAKDEEPEDWQD